ncbi:MAG: transposase [Patescibacteria group bacterium]|nr:transposase [Patescibacteria group bacterium]MDD4304228.1 transposase [Patescibacteria group bacterium]MDD4695282.1 transposase [Patescibacteria group bacterium]
MNKNKALLFKNKYRIESIRLKNWDYSDPGFYFITICIKDRENIFGEIIDGKMVLNIYGYIVKYCCRDLPNHYKNCIVDSYVIMPNHFHGIIQIKDAVRVGMVRDAFVETIHESSLREPSQRVRRESSKCKHNTKQRRKMLLSKIIGRFKMQSSKKINLVNHAIYFRWQKSYYEYIIRNEQSLYRIRQYIKNNPINWDCDRNNNK